MRAKPLEAAVRLWRRFRPFRRYTVELMTGDKFVVRHPEALSYRSGLVVFVELDGRRRCLDAESVCQVFEAEAPG